MILDAALDPQVHKREDGLQLSYHLPHRLYDAKPYARRAPNGSSIVIYGHETGVRVVWRGGRPFKRDLDNEEEEVQQEASPEQDVVMLDDLNEEKDQEVIDIDDSESEEQGKDQETEEEEEDDDEDEDVDDDDDESTDEEEQEEVHIPSIAPAQFEDEEDEVDRTRPFEEVLRHIDIFTGTKVLKLATPSYVPDDQQLLSLDSSPSILSENIVIAAICADSSVRLFTLPLTPPAPEVENLAAYGLWAYTIDEGVSQFIPAGLTFTFTSHDGDSSDAQTDDGSDWDLLLAVHTSEVTGTLLTYRIPMLSSVSSGYTFDLKSSVPIQRIYLSRSANNITFNPSPYPAECHSQLLVSFPSGAVKIFTPLSVPSERHQFSESGGVAERSHFANEGKWLVTLFPETLLSDTSLTKRIEVIDAKWVLGGKGVIALLSDGTWGIWNLAPSEPNTQTTFPPMQKSFSSFALTGRIMSSPKPVGKASLFDANTAVPRFAPMTPGTRRVREDKVFRGAATPAPVSGSSSIPSSQSPSATSPHGNISVVPNSNSTSSGVPDESIVIWHNQKTVRIPSLVAYWRASQRDPSKVFEHMDQDGRLVVLKDLQLAGQLHIGVSHLLTSSVFPVRPESQHQILLATEYQLIFLTPPLPVFEERNATSLETLQKMSGRNRMTDKTQPMAGLHRRVRETGAHDLRAPSHGSDRSQSPRLLRDEPGNASARGLSPANGRIGSSATSTPVFGDNVKRRLFPI